MITLSQLWKNTDYALPIAVVDDDGSAVDLTGATLYLTIESIASGLPVFSGSSPTEITIDAGVNGTATCAIADDDIAADPGPCRWELFSVDSGGLKTTHQTGNMQLYRSMGAA